MCLILKYQVIKIQASGQVYVNNILSQLPLFTREYILILLSIQHNLLCFFSLTFIGFQSYLPPNPDNNH